MAVDTVARSRRAVLMGALGAAVASVGAALGKPAPVRAGVDGDVVLGSDANSATTETKITRTSAGVAVGALGTAIDGIAVHAQADEAVVAIGETFGVRAETTSDGIGLKAVGGSAGVGIWGEAEDNGLRAFSNHTGPSDFESESHRAAVIGVAGGPNALRPNTDETGVYGFAGMSPISTGVWGDSTQGYGVYGSGDVGVGGVGFLGVEAIPSGAGALGVFARAGSGQTGIYAYAGTGTPPAPAANVAVDARAGSSSQVALNVGGKVRFSRSGRATISAGTSKKTISMSGITTSSYIIATPQTNRAGVYVQSVVPGANTFTINLNKVVAGTTIVGYLVIN